MRPGALTPIWQRLNRLHDMAAVTFFIIVLGVGLWVYKDYGISWDEVRNNLNGAVSYNYVCTKLGLPVDSVAVSYQYVCKKRGLRDDTLITDLHDYDDRDYGVFFELPLYALEKALAFDDLTDIFLMRHLCTFLLFWISVIFFYRLILMRFGDWRIGLTGCLFLILSPRIYADSFYNSKDLALMSFYIIGIFTMIRFFKKKTYAHALLHALSSAATVDTRIVGIIMPIITVLFYIAVMIAEKKSEPRIIIRTFPLLLYLFALAAFVILFWPYLWENPVENLLQALNNMSKFRWNADVLYMGSFTKATNLPWHYIPVWITITTPVIYTLFYGWGMFITFHSLLRYPLSYFGTENNRLDLIFLMMSLLPVLSVIMLQSVLYDGWRQLYFIYPAFLLVSLCGLVKSMDYFKFKLSFFYKKLVCTVVLIIVGVNLLNTALFMIRNHPFEQVYFNFLAGSHIEDNFELDYWGLSYRRALEYILKENKSDVINVSVANQPGLINLMMIDMDERKRVNIVPLEQSSYYLTNFRWDDYFFGKNIRTFNNTLVETYSVRVDGLKIMGVYKMK